MSDREVEELLNTATGDQQLREQLGKDLSRLVARQQQEYLLRLVYYAEPRFQLREITRRDHQYLSMLLIDNLREIKNLLYSSALTDLAAAYRTRTKDDYQIAFDIIDSLWQSRFQTRYPNILKEFDPILQLVDPKYRDHFLHQFQVFLLGSIIIDELYNTAPIQEFQESSGSALEDAWLVASTYHDFNYPIEECKTWMANFFQQNLHISENELFMLRLEKVVVIDEFLSKMQDLCAAIGCSLDDCILRFILERAAVERNHAVLGALTLLKKFQGITQIAAPALGHASLSILLHDPRNWQCFRKEASVEHSFDWECSFSNKDLIPKLTFHSYPLEFLLTFCDEIQEWGRVGRGYLETEPRLEHIEVSQQEVLIHISVKDDKSYNEKRQKIQELKGYLQDERFKIRIASRAGGSTETIPMTGI